MRIKREPLEEASINLTPLIDVVFVILIMFIVIAPLLELDRVELASGSTLKNPAQQESHLVIHVHGDNTISFNQTPVELKQLEKILHSAKVRYPDRTPQLYHDRNATFGTYQSVKNAVESAGFSKMDVLLKPQ